LGEAKGVARRGEAPSVGKEGGGWQGISASPLVVEEGSNAQG
jgi:hypothetical protein